jgi:hypothetical protein
MHILNHYRVQYPLSSAMHVNSIYVYVCLFKRRLSSLLFSFGRDLFFYDVIVVEYNNEQSMMRVKKKKGRERERGRKQNRYNPTTINDVKMTCIKLFFFFLRLIFIKPIFLTPMHSSIDGKLSKLLLVDHNHV